MHRRPDARSPHSRFAQFASLASRVALRCLAVAAMACGSVGALAENTPTAPTRLKVVGGLAGLNQYTRNEAPFWTEELSRLTDGKYTAEIAPFDQSGIPGDEMLRLMQLGVVPLGTALLSQASAQAPEFAAADLAGMNPDIQTLRKNISAFRPYLEKTLRNRHHIELLAIYTYPAQVVFCKKPIASLADLAGRRVRVSGITQSDFVGALGAIPVVTGFAQILPNMASGNTECAITGTMSGNVLGLHEVTSYVYTLPITWGLAIFGANTTAWEALPSDLRTVLRRELPKLEAAIWHESDLQTNEGLACNRGAPECVNGRRGRIKEVLATAADEKLRQNILHQVVLPRWLQRCNSRCKAIWEQTIGAQQPPLLAPSTGKP